jgi:hypothetical protein
MAEHVVAAKLAVDSAVAGDSAGIDCASKLLDRNAFLQSMVYAATWVFPLRGFHALLIEHIEHTKRYVLALAKGDLMAFDIAVARARKNAYELDGFTHRSFRR